MEDRLQRKLQELVEFTAPCRDDMHEPDEQGIKLTIVGDHLDNACGDFISPRAIREGYQEYVICLRRFDDEKNKFLQIDVNLADLIALARKAR